MRKATKTADSWAIPGREWRRKDGMLHRLGGPAIEDEDGSKSWWWNGEIVYDDETQGHENICAKYSLKCLSKSMYKRRRRDHAKANFWAPGYEKVKP